MPDSRSINGYTWPSIDPLGNKVSMVMEMMDSDMIDLMAYADGREGGEVGGERRVTGEEEGGEGGGGRKELLHGSALIRRNEELQMYRDVVCEEKREEDRLQGDYVTPANQTSTTLPWSIVENPSSVEKINIGKSLNLILEGRGTLPAIAAAVTATQITKATPSQSQPRRSSKGALPYKAVQYYTILY